MIKIGTSGYSFPDWKGTVYPAKLQPKNYLSYYQQELGFDCVEINSTYYSLVSLKMTEGIAKKTRGNFEFTVKGYRGFTHDPFDSRLGNGKNLRTPARKRHRLLRRGRTAAGTPDAFCQRGHERYRVSPPAR